MDQLPIRVVKKTKSKDAKARRPRQHPCARMTDEERRRGIADILASALVQAHRKKQGS